MAAFKQFNTNEVVLTPFHANKNFQFIGPEITASNVGIEYYQSTQGPYKSGSFPTGFGTRLDGVLVFSNIKQLYYSNFLTSSRGDNVSTASLVPGPLPEYDQYVGKIEGPRYDNFLQSSDMQDRRFAQFSSSANINGPTVISIPSMLFGEKIPPSTFEFTYTSSAINPTQSFVYDDGEGNLLATQSRSSNGVIINEGLVGQIFYSQGIAVLTEEIGDLSNVGSSIQNQAGVANNQLQSASISFSSSITIRENQYKCVVNDNEYSYTLNPSATQAYNQLSKIKNKLSSSIETTSYGNNGDPGIYTFNFDETFAGSSGGEKGTINITVAADKTISDITTFNPGNGYKPGDVILVQNGTNANLGSLIPNATGIISIKLTPTDIFNPGSDLNQTNLYYNFATGSDFSPYVTTIGLYNGSYQLVAVGKLAQPIPISLYTDTTFVVNFDT